MERAVDLGRVMLTADVDFFAIVRDRLERALPFPGMLFLKPHAEVGRAIRAIAYSIDAIDPEAQTWIKWVP